MGLIRSSPWQTVLVRGGLDRTFGTRKGYSIPGPVERPDTAYGITEGPDGQLLTCGLAGNRQRNDWGLVRYGAKGRLDQSFSGNGKAIVNMGRASDPPTAAPPCEAASPSWWVEDGEPARARSSPWPG